MTINTGYSPNKYVGNGVTTDFSIDWNPISVDFIKVVLENRTTREQEVKTLGVDYTATITDNDGIVSFMTAPSSSYNIILSRDVSLTQEVSYSQNNSYRGTLHEDSLDKIVAQNQQQAEELGRSAKLPLGSDISSLELPNPEAKKSLVWNDAGNGLENTLYNPDEQVLIATTKASEASASATNAATSATNAATSATNAATSATNAQQYAQDTKGFAPIGSLISIPCTSDYVPDGCLPCDGTQYSQSQFPALWTNYLTSSPVKLQTCTYAEYASDITTYGQCGKFAIDTTNEKFKTPYIKDGAIIQQALSDTELGKSYNAGLPNITGYIGRDDFGYFPNGSGTGAFKAVDSALWSFDTANSGSYATGFSIDASRSSPIYGNSTTVQPNAVAMRYFVVVANAQINQSQMDWSAWATSLAGKMNTDGANATIGSFEGIVAQAQATGKETVVGWGMPDYSAGVSISSGYTATKKGVIYCTGYYGGTGASGGGGYCWCKVGNSPQFLVAGSINPTEGKPSSSLFIDINVGEACTFGMVNEVNASGSVSATFYPLKGA